MKFRKNPQSKLPHKRKPSRTRTRVQSGIGDKNHHGRKSISKKDVRSLTTRRNDSDRKPTETASGERLRIVRYLALCGVCSRRKAGDLVIGKRVSVNGSVVTDLSYGVDGRRDVVTVDGKRVRSEELGLILFYKPRFVLSTLSDPHGRKSVGDYLTTHYRSYVPVGRLDFESEGLMILTNDGDLCNVLLHPRYELDRSYEVHTPGFVSDAQFRKLEQGVPLDDGVAKAEVHVMHRTPDHTTARITIREGRNRQVRRMYESIGAEVLTLKRIAHGPFVIGGLRSGEIKRLSEREYQRVRDVVMKNSERKAEGENSRSKRESK